jgi:dihydrofolate reductase
MADPDSLVAIKPAAGGPRRIIAALVISLDGYIEGVNGEVDWIRSWEDPFDLLPEIDTCLLGGRMYPDYERYWGAVMADPSANLPFSEAIATQGEVDYARFARSAPHIVLSRTLQTAVWPNTRIFRNVEEIRALKRQPGRNIHAVGGASLVGSLINFGLVDELRVVVQPILLGAGRPLFGEVAGRHALKPGETKSLDDGAVRITYFF